MRLWETKAKGNFQADVQEDFKHLTDAHGYLYKPEYSEEDLKCVEEEAAAAAAAERQAQPDSDDEEPESARAGVNWWC